MAKLKRYNCTAKHRRKDKAGNGYTSYFLHHAPKSFRKDLIRLHRARNKHIMRLLQRDLSRVDYLNFHRTCRGSAPWLFW
jgi:hypothetical protein